MAASDSQPEDWQPKTFRKSLHENLVAPGIELAGLAKGIEILDRHIGGEM